MDGKIFPDSANIWHDQAKILFNYYRQAAERIVEEEELIESNIRDLEQGIADLRNELSSKWWYMLLFYLPYYFLKKRITTEIEGKEEKIAVQRQRYKEIFRDYKVTRMGVAFVPVAEQIKYQDKSFIVDYTGAVPEQKISMSVSRRNDLLVDTIHALDALSKEAPIVETSNEAETVNTDDYSLSIQEIKENDYLGSMERALKTMTFCMEDLDTTSVTLPVVTDNSLYLPQLDTYATSELPDKATVVEVFNNNAYQTGIKKFQEINDLKNSLSNETAQFEEVLIMLMNAIGNSVQTVTRMKVASVDKIVLDSNRLLYQILKAPYNHYSPLLEADEIDRIRNEKFDYSDSIQGYEPFTLRQSSRVRYNPLTGTWIAEDGSQTVQPFGVHQMYEEIIAPMVQNLMQENRIERLKIYNAIRDQKISYLNKWHQDTDAFYRSNRAESADLINLMQQTLTEYVSAYNNLMALKRTENQMKLSDGNLDSVVVEVVDNTADTLAAFELQGQEFQKVQTEFEEYIERLKEDIDLKASKFGHVEYFDAKLRDGYSNAVAVAGAEVHTLDERRKPLASINPKLAKDSELMPEPQVSDITFDHFGLNLPAIVKEALGSLNANVKVAEPSVAKSTESMPEIMEQEISNISDIPEMPQSTVLPDLPPIPQSETDLPDISCDKSDNEQ
ncbi:MAG: hypothetical protein NC082_06255 [Clostridiales bacterium]|nr:hypothetical protein [Clostridiales bacterium]